MFHQMDAYGIVDPSRQAVGQDLWDRSAMDRGGPDWQTMTTQLTADRGAVGSQQYDPARNDK